MTYPGAVRSRYASDTVATASPATLLIMLYDRLVRDLVTAEKALADSANDVCHVSLVHAQAILLELRTSLDLTAWDGAAGLADLYSFLHAELVGANLSKDAARVAECREIIEPLRDAWREAALQAARAT